MARSNTSKSSRAPKNADPGELAAELSYSEAQTALELALAQLQSRDLAVEEMTALYQRAEAYAKRCEQVLLQVEQTIELWDPQIPDSEPQTYKQEG